MTKRVSKEKGEMVNVPNTNDSNWQARHDKFQCGNNPMLMTPFERELVAKEKADRALAKLRYELGIQGVDGGRFPRSQT